MELNEFAVDPKKSEDGFKLELSETSGVVLRSASSEKAAKVLERLMKPYVAFQKIPDDVSRRIDAQFVCQGLVASWYGPWTLDGKKIDTSKPGEMEKLLQDPRFAALRRKLIMAARNEANFKEELEAAAEKN
ncbi:hypothetical protein [Nisaea sediminum]|uniref:hypothetical protein n=1 Tax=Nisaea sediminum TaxID=2775867 RepID=UPI0018696035|nr:hypothetical protein [Nisaea sediminum]